MPDIDYDALCDALRLTSWPTAVQAADAIEALQAERDEIATRALEKVARAHELYDRAEARAATAETDARWLSDRFELPISHLTGTETKRLSAIRARLASTAEALLAEFVDDEECDLDHHGYCQTHMDFSGNECRNARAKRRLAPQENSDGD